MTTPYEALGKPRGDGARNLPRTDAGKMLLYVVLDEMRLLGRFATANEADEYALGWAQANPGKDIHIAEVVLMARAEVPPEPVARLRNIRAPAAEFAVAVGDIED